MGLSEHDQKVLNETERSLYKDPRRCRNFERRAKKLTRPSRKKWNGLSWRIWLLMALLVIAGLLVVVMILPHLGEPTSQTVNPFLTGSGSSSSSP